MIRYLERFNDYNLYENGDIRIIFINTFRFRAYLIL